MAKPLSFETICSTEVKELRLNKPHVLPIYASSSFVFDDLQHSQDVFTGKKPGYLYSRYANPTIRSVADKLAKLEGFELDASVECLLTNSGMSAISLVISSILTSGDKVLTQANLYGGTTEVLNKVFANFGIETIFTDLSNLTRVEQLITEDDRIKLVYGESPANPSLDCIDLQAIANICQRHSILSAIDNTFCTPYLQRPLNFGIDFVIHSTTKSLNGHGNSIGGAVVYDEKHHKKLWTTYKLLGLNPSPFETWLLHNGLKTLTLRMDKACSNAMKIATALESHNNVDFVNYPGLPNHRAHTIASKQMTQYGAMLSFEVKGGIDQGKRFMDKVNLLTQAPTLGDLDTLLLHPASSSHLNIDREIRIENGITDGLIRMSVGIENIDDLLTDITQALN